MPLCIGYRSAIEFWNALRLSSADALDLRATSQRRRDTAAALTQLSAGSAPHIDAMSPLFATCSAPIHVMVIDPCARTNNRLLAVHAHTAPLPDVAFAHMGDDIFVSTPEFAFAQMAGVLSLEELIALGCELCGSYGLMPDGSMFSGCPKLSSVSKLQRFVDASPRFRGRKKALRALKYVLENSASPRETKLALLLCLPYSLGGYGLDKPRLNARIELPVQGRWMNEFYVCDLYWSTCRLDVEYDSSEYHATDEALTKDSLRRTALESIGITSINVTNAHMRDSGLFNQLARSIAHIMGKRLRYHDPEFTRRHLELRHRLGLP